MVKLWINDGQVVAKRDEKVKKNVQKSEKGYKNPWFPR